MDNLSINFLTNSSLMPTYARLPLLVQKGDGAVISGIYKGQECDFIDAIAAVATCSLGHNHPRLKIAIQKQLDRIFACSNFFYNEPALALADKLISLAGMEEVFFANSGLEANETAIKIAKKYGFSRGIENPKIIVFNGSFHGRSIATMSATNNKKIKEGFGNLLDSFIFVDFDDADAVAKLQSNRDIVGVFVEPIQGESGIVIPKTDFLKKLEVLCRQNDWLLMLDEVQTGILRSGTWFAFQQADVKPDVLSLAKALGNGIPIGATLVANKAVGVLAAGNHGSTFGGNPLAAACGLEVLKIMEDENYHAIVAHKSQVFENLLKTQIEVLANVAEVRIIGLLIAIELKKPLAINAVHAGLDKGILINLVRDNVIRLLPPFVISENQIEIIITKIREIIEMG